jgi:trigger factor
MPGQEKMVMDFYQKNPSAVASLRGTVYEDKIMNLIKEKAKSNKKEISKDEAEKILKQSQDQDIDSKKVIKDKNKQEKNPPKKANVKKTSIKKPKKKPPVKKVSKK